jgi:hypothetical protein
MTRKASCFLKVVFTVTTVYGGIRLRLRNFGYKRFRGGPDTHSLFYIYSVVYWLACWPLVPEFAASNPVKAFGFFRAEKSSACLPSEEK